MDLSRVVWRRASRSTAEGDNCVEVADVPRAVAIRDSKDPHGPKLIMNRDDFGRLAEALKNL
ncbi:DUF397 domain-containing protein [Spirillospora sp. NPDC048819]|uniref:DUF397 domain-containing protein n=1 Tax=Spirillospora sp. NPDC048819 TaxID=3155268 RepID=UPI00340A8112